MKDNKVPKCAKCPAAQTALTQIQTKLTQAEARIVVLLEQLSARQSAPAPPADLSPFLTKALDSAKPDYAGLASLLTAARPVAQDLVIRPLSASCATEPTYSITQLMEMKSLFSPKSS
jgi:hypothetical protein